MSRALAHSWVEISERALRHNFSAHRRLLGRQTKLMAVVKSNAYGHGMEIVSKVAQKSGQVDWLGVASLREALALRQAGIKLPILVLGYYHPFEISELSKGVKLGISFTVYEIGALKALARAAKSVGLKAKVHLKLETGLARLGLPADQVMEFIKFIKKSSSLELEGISSHFATAESRDQRFLKQQLLVYKDFINKAKTLVGATVWWHIAGSAALTTAPEAHLSLVRLGIGLYGLWPSLENRQLVKKQHPNFKLQPVLAWKTQIIELRQLSAGLPVGYDCTYVTKRPSRLAAIPVGYWDGYDRGLSNRGQVLIRGTKCPIVGRICMNVSMVDVTNLKNVKVGDEVVLIGQQGGGEVTAEHLAANIGSINYEVVTRINPLLPRILI